MQYSCLDTINADAERVKPCFTIKGREVPRPADGRARGAVLHAKQRSLAHGAAADAARDPPPGILPAGGRPLRRTPVSGGPASTHLCGGVRALGGAQACQLASVTFALLESQPCQLLTRTQAVTRGESRVA